MFGRNKTGVNRIEIQCKIEQLPGKTPDIIENIEQLNMAWGIS